MGQTRRGKWMNGWIDGRVRKKEKENEVEEGKEMRKRREMTGRHKWKVR